MNKPGRSYNAPVERGREKADVSNFRYRVFKLLLPLLLAAAPLGCAAQKTAVISPPKAAKPADEEAEKKKEWEKEMKRLRYDREYYQQCYKNWECDTV